MLEVCGSSCHSFRTESLDSTGKCIEGEPGCGFIFPKGDLYLASCFILMLCLTQMQEASKHQRERSGRQKVN